MNERQTAHFLWVWSRRRRRGPLAAGLLGAAIGAGGGLAFAILFTSFMGLGGGEVTVDRSGLAPFFVWVLDHFGNLGMIVSMASPPFAVFAGAMAFGVHGRQERQYQALLAAGHQVPEQAPVLTWGDWAPTVIVFGGLALFIVFGLVAAYHEAMPG